MESYQSPTQGVDTVSDTSSGDSEESNSKSLYLDYANFFLPVGPNNHNNHELWIQQNFARLVLNNKSAQYHVNLENRQLLRLNSSIQYEDLELTKLYEKHPCGKDCFTSVTCIASVIELTSTIKDFRGNRKPLTDLDKKYCDKWNAENEEHFSKEKGTLIVLPVEEWAHGNRTYPCRTPHLFSCSLLSINPDKFWKLDTEQQVKNFTDFSPAKQYDFVIWIQKVVGSFSKWLVSIGSPTFTSSETSNREDNTSKTHVHRHPSVPLLDILQRSKEEFGASWSDLDVVKREFHMLKLVACLKFFLSGSPAQKQNYFNWLTWLHWWIPSVTIRIFREKGLGALSYYTTLPDNTFWILPVEIQLDHYLGFPTEVQKNVIKGLGELGETDKNLQKELNSKNYESLKKQFFGIVNQQLFHDRCNTCPVGCPPLHFVDDPQLNEQFFIS